MSCLDVLLKSGIADAVTTEKEGTSVDEIAKEKGMNADKLIRVMRLRTTMDIFTEVRDRYFRITSVGKQYRKDALLYPMFVSQYLSPCPIPQYDHSPLILVSLKSILRSVFTMLLLRRTLLIPSPSTEQLSIMLEKLIKATLKICSHRPIRRNVKGLFSQ